MDLRQLGLSEYEEKAYKALIQLGKASACEISREGQVSYGKIYEVLASLERKGLVMVIPEKTKKFVPSDPKNLMKLIDNKEKQLAEIRKEVKDLKQVYDVHEEEIVKLAKGKRNFYKIIKNRKPIKEFNYTIKYAMEYHPTWVRQHKEMLKNKVDLRTLTRYDNETKESVKKWFKIEKTIKKIDNNGVAMAISESEIIISLIKSNIIMSIKDKPFIDLMKTLYLNTYKNSPKIED